jgi:arabinofuranan 3-O-arabinosyltransferase
MRSRRTIPATLVALSYVLALVQRPGDVVADTKVHLYLDPARFLRDVVSLWSSSPDLGHVWASQYGGYAWPMAPWFALGDWVGAPTWIVHRLWLGTIFAVAAWGVVRLLDALLERERGVAHLAAGALYVVNPYVTVYADRASVTLLAYAALPWLLLAIHRGLRDPRGWRWPAIFALVLASAGGGVNAATTAWVLVGPGLLLLYELALGDGVRRGAWKPFLARLVPVATLANLWWVIPLLVAGRGAPNFLIFTEQPGTIWSTTTLPESLRLMGFWTSYVGVGYGGLLRPYQGSAPAMLLLQPVVIAGLLLPALALGSFPWLRRWRYAPFFLLLVLAGVVVMVAGWPDGTPLRRVATGVYYRVQGLQPLRTTYKAGALVALGIAVLCGAAIAEAARRRPRALVGGAAVVVAALAAWPLVTGRALERQLAFDLPPAWRAVARDLDQRPDSSRAMVLPGQLFASYRWGGTVDAVLPPLTDHPVTTRWIIPFADLRSTELQFTVDGLINQERLRPGQLRPLLDLMGVGDVIVAADGDRSRSGEMPAGDAARELAGAGGLGRGGKVYGSTVVAAPGAGRIAASARVPALRRVEVPTAGIVRVLPRTDQTVLDGAGGALAGLAAYGALDPSKAYIYAPDLAGRSTGAAGGAGASEAAVRGAARDGGAFVVSDTNRRRAFVAARLKGAVGPTLPRNQQISADGNVLDPFGGIDARGETTAEYGGGIASVSAPSSPQVTQFPDQRPFAALDGDPQTAWIGDRALAPARHTLTVNFPTRRDVATLRLWPYSDARGTVKAVTVNGRRWTVRRGWNTLPVGLRGVRSVEVHLADVTKPRKANAGAGGIRELAIPGVRATETLRPPTVIEDALRGTDLSHNALTYIFDRTTADVPAAQQKVVGARGAGELRDAQDPEPALRRVVRPPAARSYEVDGWGSVDPRSADAVFARLDGFAGDASFGSSSRFEGLGRYRASGAFDGGGGGGRSWIGQWIPGHAAWLSWTADRPRTVRALRLDPAGVRVRRPSRVRLTVDGAAGPAVAVAADGSVRLPAAVRGTDFRLDVLAARWPSGTPDRLEQRRAVGIGELHGTGMPTRRAPRAGRLELPCGIATATAEGRTYALRATTDVAALDAGRPIRLHGCGPLTLPAHDVTLIGSSTPARKVPGTLSGGGAGGLTPVVRVDGLRLTSAAPAPLAHAAVARSGGTVVDPGSDKHGGRSGVELDVRGPAWLVLGQSFDVGWRATCDGRDLGRPRLLQGYANAWPVERGCRNVSFAYAPQKLADGGYLVSGVACAALLALLAAGAWRRRRRRAQPAPDADPTPLAGPPPASPLPLTSAVAIALPTAAVIGAMFGLRAGAGAAPLLALVLWRGVSDRVLGWIVVALLALVVPAIYLGVSLFGGEEILGGNSTQYGADRLAAHWVAVAAIVLVVLLLWRTLAAARASRRTPAPDRDPLSSKQ